MGFCRGKNNLWCFSNSMNTLRDRCHYKKERLYQSLQLNLRGLAQQRGQWGYDIWLLSDEFLS